MSHDLIRLMHALFLPVADSCREGAWCPAADVYRTHAGWLVKFELAGVDPADLRLEWDGRRLTVRGVRRDEVHPRDASYYQMEIAYSHFERAVELPCEPGRAELTTDYDRGMLFVHILTEAGT